MPRPPIPLGRRPGQPLLPLPRAGRPHVVDGCRQGRWRGAGRRRYPLLSANPCKGVPSPFPFMCLSLGPPGRSEANPNTPSSPSLFHRVLTAGGKEGKHPPCLPSGPGSRESSWVGSGCWLEREEGGHKKQHQRNCKMFFPSLFFPLLPSSSFPSCLCSGRDHRGRKTPPGLVLFSLLKPPFLTLLSSSCQLPELFLSQQRQNGFYKRRRRASSTCSTTWVAGLLQPPQGLARSSFLLPEQKREAEWQRPSRSRGCAPCVVALLFSLSVSSPWLQTQVRPLPSSPPGSFSPHGRKRPTCPLPPHPLSFSPVSCKPAACRHPDTRFEIRFFFLSSSSPSYLFMTQLRAL